jgi:hypothetical protein
VARSFVAPASCRLFCLAGHAPLLAHSPPIPIPNSQSVLFVLRASRRRLCSGRSLWPAASSFHSRFQSPCRPADQTCHPERRRAPLLPSRSANRAARPSAGRWRASQSRDLHSLFPPCVVPVHFKFPIWNSLSGDFSTPTATQTHPPFPPKAGRRVGHPPDSPQSSRRSEVCPRKLDEDPPRSVRGTTCNKIVHRWRARATTPDVKGNSRMLISGQQ